VSHLRDSGLLSPHSTQDFWEWGAKEASDRDGHWLSSNEIMMMTISHKAEGMKPSRKPLPTCGTYRLPTVTKFSEVVLLMRVVLLVERLQQHKARHRIAEKDRPPSMDTSWKFWAE